MLPKYVLGVVCKCKETLPYLGIGERNFAMIMNRVLDDLQL
jgi:hypothetical protein